MSGSYTKWGEGRAWVDGVPFVLVDPPTRILSALRGRSTCAVSVRDLPVAGGKPAQVDIIRNGRSERFFTGLTAERSAQAATMQRATNLVDLLDLERAIPAAITWSSTSFPDAVRDLLAAAGIAEENIDSIFDPGASYVLGPVYPITITTRETVAQAWRELMAFGGTSAYVTPAGRVRVVDSPGIPAPTSATIYAEGPGAGELGIYDAGVSIEGNESVVSVFTALGPKRPDGAIPDGTFTATGIVGKPASQSYRFAQSDSTCVAIARRELGRRARALTNLWFTALLHTQLQPGDTVLFRCPRIGYPSSTPAFVLEVATQVDGGMRVIISIGPSLIDGYDSSIKPPVVDFAMRVEHQLVTLAGVPVAGYFVQCEDLSRDPQGRAITSRSWSATGPDASPSSSSEERPIFLFTDLAGAEITLEVESESGESATVTKSPVAQDLQVLSRIVSVATGDGWRVLEGVGGWRTFAAPGGASCTSVPAFNERGPLLSGWSSGAIYQSADALATAPPLLTTLNTGGIGALFVNEADELYILAGAGSSLHRSVDGGAIFVEVHDFDDAITDIQSSPSNPNEIRVTAGEALYLSFDGGANWSVSAAGISGSQAEALASAPWGHAAVFSNVGSSYADAVKFEEGYAVDWSGVDPAELPADGLTSITPLLDEEAFVVGEANDLIRDGALSALVLSAGAGNLYKLLWDGAQFVASLLPPAEDSGAGKLIASAAHYPIDDVSATSVGYGALANAAMPATTFPSLSAEAVGLNLGVGGAPPLGWEAPAFDASGWDAAVVSSFDVAGPAGLAGAQTIAAPGATLDSNVMVVRQTVTIPAGRVERARIRVARDGVVDLYIGGTFVGTHNQPSNPVTFDVPPALLVAGPLVIATKIVNDVFGGSSPQGVAYLLEVNYEL